MSKRLGCLKEFLSNRDGITAIEYGLISAFASVVTLAAMTWMGIV